MTDALDKVAADFGARGRRSVGLEGDMICILWKTWKEKKSCNIFKCDDRNMHCLFVTCAVCDGVREV